MTDEIELYQPSNGNEGMGFWESWCDRCEHDRKFRESQGQEGGCQILADSLLFDVTERGYPREWRYVDGQPACTAFVPEKRPHYPERTRRCTRTHDLFDTGYEG